MVVGTATLVFMNRSAIHSIADANPIEIVLPVTFAAVGALVASRRPGNPIGWIFLVLALFGAIPGISEQYVVRGVLSGPEDALVGLEWMAWLTNWAVIPIFPAGLVMFAFLLFPDGRFMSPRWRNLALAGAAFSFVMLILIWLDPVPIVVRDNLPPFRNPTGVSSFATEWLEGPAGGAMWLVGMLFVLTAAVGIIVRLRRAKGQERQQLKWFAFAAMTTVAALVAMAVAAFAFSFPEGVWEITLAVGFGLGIPLACGVAILKHGLYEIDVVINKTLVFGILAAFITAIYVAIVVGIGAALGSTSNRFLPVIAAVAIAVAFQPLRERARRFANRLVFGKRATPYEVLSEFSERMAGTYASEDLLPRMARILAEGTGARRAGVWLKVGTELVPEASWPDDAEGRVAPMPMPGDDLPPLPDASLLLPVRHRGEVLGALSLTKAPGEALTPAEEKLALDLASQAGLVLRNARLIEELRASRARLVKAQDEERRRLERNIHDGAQQQLVALSVKLGLARSLARRDAEKTEEMLDQLQREAIDTLENLRDLARGIYPPLLADQGLAVALTSQARKATLPVEVDAEGLGRYPPEAEAAVYFCVLEAIQNVSKYAGAERARVRLAASNGALTFSVTDDGRGFDPGTIQMGAGLQNMADRLSALGGGLEVESAPGHGTTVSGLIPV